MMVMAIVAMIVDSLQWDLAFHRRVMLDWLVVSFVYDLSRQHLLAGAS